MESTDTVALLVDSMMPNFDTAIAEHIIVRSDTATTFAAARDLDLLTVHSPLLGVSMWLRGMPARVFGRNPVPPATLKINEDKALPGWVHLGQTPGREIAFGAVGRFWQPVIEWRDTAADDFVDFSEPGWGKIAANFSVRPYGTSTSLLSYECRTLTTDLDSRKRFARYWRLIRPFVRHIMQATVRQIKADAESPRARLSLTRAVSQ